MKEFKTITPQELTDNPFSLIARDWALLSAGTMEKYNTMTVSWGGFGVLWEKPSVTVYVRPTRYTYDFMENSSEFTLSFFPEQYRKALSFCGSKSGRDFDKAKETGLNAMSFGSSVGFEEARLVILCKKRYFQDFDPKNFLDEKIEKVYPQKDYHRFYVGEILSIYKD